MHPVVAVLREAARVRECPHVPAALRVRTPGGDVCTGCSEENKRMQNNYSEALLECRDKGYVTWKNMCGWTLTRDGRHFYNALRGIYNEDSNRKFKRPIE